MYVDTVAESEFMKVKMRGLRRKSPRGSSAVGSSQHSTGNGSSRSRGSRSQNKLPPMSDPHRDGEGGEKEEGVEGELKTRLSITVTRTTDQDSKQLTTPTSTLVQTNVDTSSSPVLPRASSAPSPPHVGVICLGEGDVTTTTRTGGHRSRQQLSGKARLSHGWSPPQPIQPLQGSPIHTTPPRGVGGGASIRGREKPEGKGKEVVVVTRGDMTAPAPSPTPSMMISVNVNEFLSRTDND